MTTTPAIETAETQTDAVPEAMTEAMTEVMTDAATATAAVIAREAGALEPGEWYVIGSYSGHEKKVKTNLEMRIQTLGMEARIYEVAIPTEEVIEFSGGKKVTKQRNTFPGYVLIRARMDDEVWHAIRETPGVTGFVGSDDQHPAPLSKREVARFLGGGELSVEEGALVQKSLWQVGEGVRIVAGPFADMSGVVAEIGEEGAKLVVLVDIFGRDTPVEMAATDVVKP